LLAEPERKWPDEVAGSGRLENWVEEEEGGLGRKQFPKPSAEPATEVAYGKSQAREAGGDGGKSKARKGRWLPLPKRQRGGSRFLVGRLL